MKSIFFVTMGGNEHAVTLVQVQVCKLCGDVPEHAEERALTYATCEPARKGVAPRVAQKEFWPTQCAMKGGRRALPSEESGYGENPLLQRNGSPLLPQAHCRATDVPECSHPPK